MHLHEDLDIWEAEKKAWRINDSIFWVDEHIERKHIEWAYMKSVQIKKIIVGKPNNEGNPAKYYLVLKDNQPYLIVEVYYDYNPVFPSYTLWHHFLLIGRDSDFYYIDLLTYKKSVFSFEKWENGSSYFNDFYQLAGFLLVASCKCLYSFDDKCNLVWQTETIACDGVIVHRYKRDGYLYVSGENDPPNGWIEFRVEFTSGLVKKG